METPLKGGWTALMYACDNGNTEMIDLLLGCGANPNSNKGMCSRNMHQNTL